MNMIYNIVPIIVPFHDDLSVDFDSLKKHALFLRNNGIKSVVVGGTTGEGLSLSLHEKRFICEFLSDFGFITVGCISSFDWISARDAINAFSSAQYLLVMPPMFVRPSALDIKEFFDFVSQTSNKEIILYNNPSRTNIDISKMYESFPYVLGVKETKFSSFPSIPWWCGEDSFAVESINLGAVGLISACANVFPLISERIALKVQSDHDAQMWNSNTDLIFKFSNPLAIKYVLKRNGIIQSEKTRFALKIRDAEILDRITLNDIK